MNVRDTEHQACGQVKFAQLLLVVVAIIIGVISPLGPFLEVTSKQIVASFQRLPMEPE